MKQHFSIALVLVMAYVPLAGSQTSRIDFRFDFIKRQAEALNQLANPFPATIRFARHPDEAILDKLERMGVRFEYYNGTRLATETVFPVQMTLNLLPELEQIEEIAAVQPSWRPVRVPPLDVSRPQVQADTVWQRNDQRGQNITGKGVLIADFDTGVDFFNPMLWFADGDTLDWIDVNGNGTFDPGVDAVDKNGNGTADTGELLRYKEIAYSANTAGVYDVNLDFLYNDANNNGVRDYGTGGGFTESSPTYGEQWFITLDANHNNRLDVGEILVGLKTSKIRAIREANGTVRRRGIDLINATPDNPGYGGHGTSVSGIAIGGVPGVSRLAGIAPGAEMIYGTINYTLTPRFFTELPVLMTWAQAEGANIMLVEDGEWVWEYLDGSSNEEIMINELAASGITQVMPAGNLTGGAMQKTMMVNANDSTTATFTGGSSSSVWPSVRWLGDTSDVVVKLQVGASNFVTLPGDGSTITIGTKSVYSNRSVSSRGTVMMLVYIASSGGTTYNFRVVNTTSSQERVEGMLGDNGFAWSGLARWSAPTENNTATWPSTADSAIGVAAYKSKSNNTDINTFSGRGTRIDGVRTVDVAAPGSTVYSIGLNTTYVGFGGTSSAGPHVAGAAALILQADTTLRHRDVRRLLRAGAIADQYTGTVPNTTWGFGKLRINNSIGFLTSVPEERTLPVSTVLAQNYPNPFNPSTRIEYRLSAQSHVTVKIYNILGQEVASLVDEEQSAGNHSAEWNGKSSRGFSVSSGVYFYRLEARQGGGRFLFASVKKMLLLK